MTTEASIPTWSAYNSLIPAPAHEWSTLLTVLKQKKNRNTVITLDIDLYKPGKQLEKYCEDLQVQFILQLGELRAVMGYASDK